MHTKDGGQVGMVQRCQQLRLSLETSESLRILRERVGQELDRDLAVEGGVQRLPHHAHPTLADLLDQAVVE